MPLTPFRTAEAPPVYQPCPSPRSVPQQALLCTNYAPDPVPYLRFPSRVPTVSSIPFRTAEAPPVYQPCPSIPFRTSEAPPVYQPCPSPRSVPQQALLCTNYAPDPVPYLRFPSRVPTVSSIPFRTSRTPPVYQPCPSPRSVPQEPLLCTNRAPYLVLCRESTFFEPNSAHNI